MQDRRRIVPPLALAIADAASEVARRSPAPRDLPFFGLDHVAGVLGRVLADLADLGIFRFYSRVLDLSPGYGGPARWLVRRHGCRATRLHRRSDDAVADAFLTREAHLTDRIAVTVGSADALPFEADRFTHVWGVAALSVIDDPPHAFREALRVLRPGGWLALAGPESDAVSFPALEAAGFRDLEVRDASGDLEDDSAVARLVAERVEERLRPSAPPREVPRRLLRAKARKPS